MVLRLLTHWRDWRGDADYPFFAQVDPARMAEIWNFSFVLDIVGRGENPSSARSAASSRNICLRPSATACCPMCLPDR